MSSSADSVRANGSTNGRPHQESIARETALGQTAPGQTAPGDVAEETQWWTRQDAVLELLLYKEDVRAEIFAFTGGRPQPYLFVGMVSKSWRTVLFEGKPRNTAESHIVASVPRAMEALHCGWEPSNGAWKVVAALGNVQVLNLLLDWSNDACDLEWGEWGDRVFAAAAEAGHTDVMKLLIAAGCNTDQMELKALEVAVESGSAAILDCCDSSDLGRGEDGFWVDEGWAVAEAIVTSPLPEAMAGRDFGMVRSLSRFSLAAGETGGWMQVEILRYAKDNDLKMLRCLEEMIMCSDGRFEGLFWSTFWTAASYGSFRTVAQLLTWWWTDDENHGLHGLDVTGGQQLVPDGVLFMVARLGHLQMLQWCRTNCPLVSRDLCLYCASPNGWSRVPADAAGAGHVDLVLWCLDNGWNYSERWMESAAKEGRSNVIAALVGRGFACQVQVEQAAPCDVEGDDLMGRYLRDLPRCEWH
ncbi:unnamed protein product [Ectocarpus sp. CCAP 1310/34]|nr:unnamed protein product [Ectocarpus sp. CCAP 1310/34]